MSHDTNPLSENNLRKLGDSIDKLISIEITGRGIIGQLYDAARAAQGGEPMTMRVAQALLDRVKQKDVVVIVTGLPTFPWNVPEQDGPVAAATLARALVLAVGAKPIILTDPRCAEACRASLIGAGINCLTPEEMLKFPTTGCVIAYPTDWDEARAAIDPFFAKFDPKAFITIERPGANEKGEYHSAGGRNFTDACAKIDVLLEAANKRGVLTVGIGDGGNEIGNAWIRETVFDVVPVAKTCKCPCGGSVVPQVKTDLFIMAAISNWGSYGVEACMATLLGRPEIFHDKELDLRVHQMCAAAGANNNGPGLLDLGTDAVPVGVHGAFLDVMAFVVKSSMDPGRLYRNPRYPWLY